MMLWDRRRRDLFLVKIRTTWIDAIVDDDTAQKAIRIEFGTPQDVSIDMLLEQLLSNNASDR